MTINVNIIISCGFIIYYIGIVFTQIYVYILIITKGYLYVIIFYFFAIVEMTGVSKERLLTTVEQFESCRSFVLDAGIRVQINSM
jgi:hypothetical protein